MARGIAWYKSENPDNITASKATPWRCEAYKIIEEKKAMIVIMILLSVLVATGATLALSTKLY